MMPVMVLTRHGHIAKLNKKLKTNSSRQFFAAPSKTADSKAVSVTCELIVEQNILLATARTYPVGPDAMR